MASQEQTVEQLFGAALDRRPEDRRAFLDEVCAGEPELRRRVEELLHADDQAGSFLEKPLLSPAEQSDPTLAPGGTEKSQGYPRSSFPAGRFEPGEIIAGRFTVIRFIARGGMGEVYEVEDRELKGVHLALKTVLPHIAADPSMHERFQREVLLAREVVHPNLCPIYDMFHWQRPECEVTFLTMKLLSGETLAARINRQGPIPLPEAARIVAQVAAGLSAAHNAGILHRDIKAANIMLDGAGEGVFACVTDFGLARANKSESTVITVDGFAGTLGYIAPELFYGDSPSPASDVFAFGVVVYQMLTGHLPQLSPESKLDAAREPLLKDLPSEWRVMIEGCLEPAASRRFRSIAQAIEPLSLIDQPSRRRPIDPSRLSRRRVIALGASAAVVLAGGVWLDWPDLRFVLEPLPKKRSVALMAWPASDLSAIVSTILNSIGSRLVRAEASVKDLLIISLNDLPTTTASLTIPSESVSALGANLVLAAYIQTTGSKIVLTLQVLEAATQRVLRKAKISSTSGEINILADRASESAARLLALPDNQAPLKDPDELTHISPDVFRAFSEAEQLANEPNSTGLEGAVLKYQQVLDMDPHFALAYAKLALVYIRQYLRDREPAKLRLAQSNGSLAIRYNPDSAKGLLSQALVFLYSGKTKEAFDYFSKSLKADPGNPETLVFQAQGLQNVGRWQEAESVYNEILVERPNYWPAYNELGWILSRQAKYQKAAEAFDAAAVAAPKVAMPLANLGTMYLELGKRDEAIAACNRSLERSPNDTAYLMLGDIAFTDGDYKTSLENYKRAAALNPRYHLIWRNIADCYAMLGQPVQVKENYTKAAHLLSDALALNPRGGPLWAILAFYHAKIGDAASAETDLKNAEAQGAKDVESQFSIVQALVLLGRKEEALKLLLWCMDKGLSRLEIDLALDLKDLRKDPRYLSKLAKPGNPGTVPGA